MFLLGEPGIVDDEGALIRELTLDEAKALAADLPHDTDARDAVGDRLRQSIRACRGGVSRVHIIDRGVEGALLLELFSRDGVGTMVNADAYDSIRRATIDDIGGILELIRPLEESGALVRRSRERLETEIAHFSVVDRDGAVVACAAMYPYPGDRLAELACLAVDDAYRRGQYGERLLTLAEREAREAGAERLFVLTTQATHWIRERGFVEARPLDTARRATGPVQLPAPIPGARAGAVDTTRPPRFSPPGVSMSRSTAASAATGSGARVTGRPMTR